MKRKMSNIEFETRDEVEELMDILEKCLIANPEMEDNNVWKTFYDLLDTLDMAW